MTNNIFNLFSSKNSILGKVFQRFLVSHAKLWLKKGYNIIDNTKDTTPMAHILLAEDDDSMRGFLTLALEKAGHRVTPCADGLAAYKAAEDLGAIIDLLVADIVMPGMDGIELSQRVGQLHPHIKILFITGFSAVAMGAGLIRPVVKVETLSCRRRPASRKWQKR
jgi:two-component system cell cycle response regulator CpdR